MNLRELFTAAKNMLSPTPLAELPLIRHPEMEGNGDLEFWSDMKYLHALRSDIFDELNEGAFLWEMPIPVLSESIWDELLNSLNDGIEEFSSLFIRESA